MAFTATHSVKYKAASPSPHSSLGSNKTKANTSGETNTFDRNSGWKPLRTASSLPKEPQATVADLITGLRLARNWRCNRDNGLRDLSYTQDVFDSDDEFGPPVNDATGEFRIKESWFLPTGAQEGPASRLQRAALDEQSANGPIAEEDEEDASLDAEASSRRLESELAQCDMSQLDGLLSEQCELFDRDLEQSANGPIEEYEDDDGLGTEAFEVDSRREEAGMLEWYKKHLDWLFSEVCEMVDWALEQQASSKEAYEEDDSNGTEAFDDAGGGGMKASADYHQWPGHVYGEHAWVDFRLEQLAAREEVAGYEEDDSRGTGAFDPVEV